MAVNVRKRRLPSGETHWQADIRVRLLDGSLHRERVRAPGKTRAQALRWARQREVYLLRHGVQRRESEEKQQERHRAASVPTFAEFMPRFFQDHVLANRLSPTTQQSYASTIKNHLMPVLADVRLDRVAARHTQALKRARAAASTVNLVLKHLKVILNAAARWGVIERVPAIKPLKQPERHPVFYDFGDYRRLVSGAAGLGPDMLAAVRLGGDAGLRCGEMLGLRWANVHLERGKLLVCDNLVRTGEGEWVLRVPKGGRPRWVPISDPLGKALRAVERRGEHVLTYRTGRHLVRSTITRWLARAQRDAGLERAGVHVLRHTFCSQLVLRGVHVRTIQKLAGHAKLSTTEVYMHLVTEAEEDAIRRLREDEQDE